VNTKNAINPFIYLNHTPAP